MKIWVITTSLVIIFSLNLLWVNGQSVDEYSDLEDKKILLVYGGWEGHQPEKFAGIITQWLEEQGGRVIVSNSTQIYTNQDLINSVDLIIQSITMSELKKNESRGLLKAVKSGVGFAGCHGGAGDAFRSDTEYQYMVGGQFVSHPGGQLEYQVQIVDSLHSITRGIKDFSVHTEQYYMHIDPNNTVLATTHFTSDHHHWIQGTVIPVVWIKHYGKGRVFYSSLGHAPKDITHLQSWKILTRGIEWAANSKSDEHLNLVSPIYQNRNQ
ncbi:MAG: ThuA domain-containing protein [Flavobacteriaceae bacterium]|nr:ThuA domain-containing protein [Flavobacteriaceae bacterium]